MTDIIESGIHFEVKMDNLVNERLREQTAKITSLLDGAKYNLYEVAMRLLVIKKEELYKDDGFTNVYDYTKKMFGYGKNMTYKMITTAEALVEEKMLDENKVEYRSIICHDDCDYSMSQLFELGTLAPKDVVELDAEGAIDPSMTTKEIRNIVKEHKPAKKKNTKDTSEKTDTEIIEGDEKKQKEKLHNSYLKDIDKLYDTYEKLQKNPLLDTDEGKTSLNRLLEAIENMNY